MHSLLSLECAEGDGWQGIDLPYNNGFVMRLILPEQGTNPPLDETALAETNASMDDAGEALVALTLPPWEHTYVVDLKEMLATMGLT